MAVSYDENFGYFISANFNLTKDYTYNDNNIDNDNILYFSKFTSPTPGQVQDSGPSDSLKACYIPPTHPDILNLS